MGESIGARRRVLNAAQEAIDLANDCHTKISNLGAEAKSDREAVRAGVTAIYKQIRKLDVEVATLKESRVEPDHNALVTLKQELADQTVVSASVAGELQDLKKRVDAIESMGLVSRVRYVITGRVPAAIAVLALALAVTGCASSFVHGPTGATPTMTVLELAEAYRLRVQKTAPYPGCWTAFTLADGLSEVRCPYPWVPEGVQLYRACVDPQWRYGLNLGDGVIVACGQHRGKS